MTTTHPTTHPVTFTLPGGALRSLIAATLPHADTQPLNRLPNPALGCVHLVSTDATHVRAFATDRHTFAFQVVEVGDHEPLDVLIPRSEAAQAVKLAPALSARAAAKADPVEVTVDALAGWDPLNVGSIVDGFEKAEPGVRAASVDPELVARFVVADKINHDGPARGLTTFWQRNEQSPVYVTAGDDFLGAVMPRHHPFSPERPDTTPFRATR